MVVQLFGIYRQLNICRASCGSGSVKGLQVFLYVSAPSQFGGMIKPELMIFIYS